MAYHIIFLYTYFFSIFLTYSLLVYQYLPKYQELTLDISIIVQVASLLYLVFYTNLLSSPMVLASVASIITYILYKWYGRGIHLYSTISLSAILLVAGIITWAPPQLVTAQLLTLYLSSITMIIATFMLILVLSRVIGATPHILPVIFSLALVSSLLDGISAYISYDAEGFLVSTYAIIPVSVLTLFIIYALYVDNLVLKYLGISTLLLIISSDLAMDLSGLNGGIYGFHPANMLIIYYVFIPLFLTAREYIGLFREEGSRLVGEPGIAPSIALYIITIFVWIRGLSAGIIPSEFIETQSIYLNDFIIYILPIIIFLLSYLVLGKVSASLGITLLYLSLNNILSIYGFAQYSLVVSILLSIVLVAYLVGFNKSHYLAGIIIIILLLGIISNIDYAPVKSEFQLMVLTGQNGNVGLDRDNYALLRNITYDVGSKIVSASFTINIKVNEISLYLENYLLNKKIYSISVAASELYLIKGADLIIIYIVPDSSLMGSMDYYASAIQLSHVEPSELIQNIFGLLICRVFIFRNFGVYLGLGLLTAAIPLLYLFLARRIFGLI